MRGGENVTFTSKAVIRPKRKKISGKMNADSSNGSRRKSQNGCSKQNFTYFLDNLDKVKKLRRKKAHPVQLIRQCNREFISAV